MGLYGPSSGSSSGSLYGGSKKTTAKGGLGGAQARSLRELKGSTKKSSKTSGWLTTPAKVVLRAANVPAFGVGNLIRNPRAALTMSGRELFTDEKKHVFASKALEERGVKYPGGALGFALKLGTDIATDPLTYASFGTAGLVKGSVGGGTRASALLAANKRATDAEKIMAAAAKQQGRRVGLVERAPILAKLHAERAAAPRALTFGLRVPFSRGRSVMLGESRGAGQAAEAIGKGLRKITPQGGRDTLTKTFLSTRGADKRVGNLYQDLARQSNAEYSGLHRQSRVFNRDLHKAEKATGLKSGEGIRALYYHLNDPAKYPLPKGFDELAERYRGFRDEIDEIEQVDGIIRGSVSDYVPRVFANADSARRYRELQGHTDANRFDHPWFTKPREFEFDEFMEFAKTNKLDVEMNPAELVAKRAKASTNARVKAAVDSGVASEYGAMRLARVPDTGKAAAKLEREQTKLTELAPPTPQGRRAAARFNEAPEVPETGIARTVVEVDDEVQVILAASTRAIGKAQKQLKKAQASKSPKAIAQARGALRRSQQNQRAVREALASSGSRQDVVRQTRKVVKAEKNLGKKESAAAEAIEHNRLLEARPGLLVEADEWAQIKGTWREMAEAKKYHDGTRIPPEIDEALNRVYRHMDKNLTPESLGGAARFLNNLSGRWKGLALATPGFHLRNMQDDALRAYWAGARNPASFIAAYRMLRWNEVNRIGGRGVKGAEGTVKIKGETYTWSQFMDLAERHGVTRTGFVPAEVGSVVWDKVAQKWVQGPGRGPVVRVSSEIGQYREDMTRLGTFMELMKRGDDPFEAARLTREYLFDYGDVSAFIAATRRLVMPFITFPSKAIPQTAKVFAMRPGIPANINKLVEHAADAAGNPDLSALPLSAGTRFPVPSQALPPAARSFLGLTEGMPALYNAKNVTGFASLDLLDPRVARQNIGAGLVSPLLRIPFEQASGKQVYTNRDFAKSGARAPWLVQQAARIPGVGPAIGYKSASHPDAKRDFYTNKAIASYNSRIANIVGGAPFIHQVEAALGQSTGSSRNSQLRYGAGFSISPYDKAREEKRRELFESK